MILVLGQVLFTLLMYGAGVVLLGLALFPALWLTLSVWIHTQAWALPGRVLLLSVTAVTGYFLFGFTLIALVGIARLAFRLRLREGVFPMFSPQSAKWVITNALQFIVWVTFGDFILLTPFASLLYRLMGARIGRHVQINSKYCADLSLLEIGDGAVIGGHATVIAHAFERQGLVLRRVRIGRHAVIGLNAVLLPGAEVGDRAVVAAAAVVPKDAKVAPGTTYLGIGRQEAQTA